MQRIGKDIIPPPSRGGDGGGSHIILLADGMADWPCEELGGKTLLQYADTPHFDWLAKHGRNGLLKTIPDGFHPGSEVANSSILGYNQHLVYEGRGPLEAASIGVELQEDDLALRCNLVCLDGDLLKNHSCGRLETEEGDVLMRFLQEKLGSDRVHFYTGVQYRHLLVIKGGNKHLRYTPPHDIPLKPWREYMLQATCPEAEETAKLLTDLILRSQELLAQHPLNIDRQKRGMDAANCIWPWGGGYRPKMTPLTETYPQIRKGAVITAVDLIRGIGRYAGLDVINVPGATGLWDTDFRAKAKAAIEALRTHDFVYLHVEASDEAGHDGDLHMKLGCIEHIDHLLLAPIMEELLSSPFTGNCSLVAEQLGRALPDGGQKLEGVSISLLPDHPTPIHHRTHTAEPVPFCIYYPGIEPDKVQTFDEVAASEGIYGTLEGDAFIKEFMKY